ncbi:MAG: hypothetical protein H6662_07920 [Ardenticatenaceae bacterium]|nr:hypothetical protein [Ardenticatenaceae bacterium]MCB8990898.1 hypothetical protein [Ardenticatenaceae bacterium]MCB9004965.1 hypothetical protein [Ardenticatenaceae bacterium]
MINLTPVQETAVTAPHTSFLLGPAGSGKTTALQHRLLRLLQEGETAYTLLILVAEPDHQQGYRDFIHQSGLGPYADLKITTYIEMAREMVALFWPLVARDAGFARPYQPPTFLSYDLAQLQMWRIITPMLADGAFSDLRLRPQQIVSQLLDTLNRAALNALSLDEAIARQRDTWVGEPERLLHLTDAAKAARRFRKQCLENSLLDLSLVIEVFDTQLIKRPEFHRYFSERYRHLIVDNVEEQTPAGQNFVANLMNATQTTAVAYDSGGGYKRFMAADPLGANKFRTLCQRAFDFAPIFTAPPEMQQLANVVENHLMHTTHPTAAAEEMVITTVNGRYRRDMVHNLIPLLAAIIAEDGVHPRDIAIISPYLDGALRYTLTQALQAARLPYYLLRRRSSPREEPRVRAWLTWLALAHPQWGVKPAAYDVAEAFDLSLHEMDPARAQLLTSRLYMPEEGALLPIAELPPPIAARIGEPLLELVEELRLWLAEQDGRTPLDTFLYNLFANLLAQPRFQPKPDLAGAAVCDWLVRAAGRLRQSAAPMGLATPGDIGRAFIEGIYNGLVTARPPELGEPPDPDGIMISTIYGYLLAGRPARVQVWLETAATGWWDIPNQPLSNAFVLAQSRPADLPWSTEEDFAIRNQLLSRIIRGLAVRCQDGVILATSELDRRGQRQDGVLWRALKEAISR